MIRRIRWYQPGVPAGMPHSLQFIWLNIFETVQIPTPKPCILLFHMIRRTHSLTPTVGPQVVCPTSSQKPFRSVPSIKGLKMLLSSNYKLNKRKRSPHGSSFYPIIIIIIIIILLLFLSLSAQILSRRILINHLADCSELFLVYDRY